MSTISPTSPSLSVAEPTTGVPALELRTNPDSPMGATNEVPKHNGDYIRDNDEQYDEDARSDDGNDGEDGGDETGIQSEGMDKTVGEDYGVNAGLTSVIAAKGKATEKGEFVRFTEEVLRGDEDYGKDYDEGYDEDYDEDDGEDYDEDDGEDDGGDSPGTKDKNDSEDDRGIAKNTPSRGAKGKGKEIATHKHRSKGDMKEIPNYNEGYDDDDHEDDGGSTGGTAVEVPKGNGKSKNNDKGKGKGKATDKRKFGGSSKGRKCYRWTPKQEKTAIAGMLQIRAEGEILGDACFEELHRRLLSKDPAWNHSVSGIHNAWHRRDLVQQVMREEAKAKQEKQEQQAKEDEQLGLSFRSKRPLKRKSGEKCAIPARDQKGAKAADGDSDEESMLGSKRLRTDSHHSPMGTNLRNPDTALSHDQSAANVFASPATVASDQPPLDFPTVTIGFKRYNNSSRRTREFAEVNTMNRFWNQVVATPMFSSLESAFMVVLVWIGAAQKPHYMAQHDKVDYADFIRLVGKAAAASGDEEIVVNVTAAL